MTVKSQFAIIGSQQQTLSSTRSTSHCEVDLWASEQGTVAVILWESEQGTVAVTLWRFRFPSQK